MNARIAKSLFLNEFYHVFGEMHTHFYASVTVIQNPFTG